MDREKSSTRSACLTNEQIAEWVDGGASPEQKEDYAAHIAECEACATLSALMGMTSDALPPGARVGRYEIVARIGAGGMGTVYSAHDPALDRLVALKLIRAQAAGPELEVRLLREAKTMARVSHPEVIAVYDAGRDGDRLFIAMELVDGGTLREWLAAAPRSWRETLALYVRAGRGLAQAHALGLVHRDFKPDNVLVGKDGRVRVVDFGLARSSEASPPSASPRSLSALALDQTAPAPLTRTGALIGTPAYMTPEQLRGAPADARSDIYSFCVALYEALYGARPFGGATLAAHLEEKAAGSVVAPESERGVPPGVRRALVAGMSPDPARRYASMEGLLALLERETEAPKAARRRRVAAALASLVAVAGATAWWQAARSDAPRAAQAPSSVETAVTALTGTEGRLACPIFDVRGMSDAAVRLGAAAGTLACGRAIWDLGGDDGRVLPPAALLDMPTQPADAVPDPYLVPEQRARTLEAARARASAYLDGTVTRERDSWVAALVIRAPDDREIARAQGTEATFVGALREALEEIWKPPLVVRAIDPEVARWSGLPDVAAGRLETDVRTLDARDKCGELAARAGELGRAVFEIAQICQDRHGASFDAAAPRLDESSPEALVTSVRAMAAWQLPLAPEEERRLATKLDGLRDRAESGYGRARLAYTAGLLWSLANEPERAQASLRLSVREDPIAASTWELIIAAAGGGTPLGVSASSVARAWLPNDGRLVPKAGSWRADELDARLRDARLAYVLEPKLLEALHLGRALAEAGRADDARALASTPLGDAESNRVLTGYVLGLLDAHDAKLTRALAHLEDAGNVALPDLVVVADVAGHAEEVARRWAERFLASPDAEVDMTARGYHSPMILCMRAGAQGGLANRCLDRIALLGRTGMNWWFDGGTALLAGARRYASGDLRGAAASWRPLVTSPNLEIVRTLPAEVFERAGEPELARRLDERKMAFAFVAGISDAAPREARRAFAAGDTARAAKLARAVVGAWEVADVEVPAVAQMRALLKTIER